MRAMLTATLALVCALAGDAAAADYYVLTGAGSVYKNGAAVESQAYDKPVGIAVDGSTYWVLTGAGSVYKNGAAVESKAYDAPVAIAVDGST
jgi:hypothetical protein